MTRLLDHEIIAIEKEANSTFYNGNGIKGGRTISIDGIEVLTTP